MKGLLIAVLVLALVTVAMPARAADKTVTFQVPVKVENLDPQVGTIFMRCTITGPDYSVTNMSSQIPVRAGVYTGMLSVPVTVLAADLGKVREWHCQLILSRTGGGPFSEINNPNNPWSKAAPGSVHQVYGQF